MRRQKTIEYIVNTPIKEIVKGVDEGRFNATKVIESAKDARKEFGLKVESLLNELSQRTERYMKGMILEAKEDCMNNFTKGQRVTVTSDEDDNHDVVLDDVVSLDASEVRKYFKKVGYQS